jgi:hypothetical protein
LQQSSFFFTVFSVRVGLLLLAMTRLLSMAAIMGVSMGVPTAAMAEPVTAASAMAVAVMGVAATDRHSTYRMVHQNLMAISIASCILRAGSGDYLWGMRSR